MSFIGRTYDYITGRDTLKARIKTQDSQLSKTLSAILTGNAPGTWASDHYREAEQYKDFPYIAIMTIAKQMLQARVETEIPESHPAFKLINQPNPEQSRASFDFARAQQSHLTGTCVIWDRTSEGMGRGILEKRYVLPTALLSPAAKGFNFSWKQAAAFNTWMQVPIELMQTGIDFIPFEECSINRFVSPLYLGDGTSPTGAGSKFIDVSNQILTAWFNENANAVRPGLVITEDANSELTLEDRKRVQSDLYAEHSGAENKSKNLFLPKGLIATPWAKTSEELDNLNSLTFIRNCILACYGVTPIAAGILEAGNRSAYYAALLQFIEICIQPYLDLLGEEDTVTYRKYWPDIKPIIYKARRIDDPDILSRERAEMSKAVQMLATTGMIQVNEGRRIMSEIYPLFALKDIEGGDQFTRAVRETIRTTGEDLNIKDDAQIPLDSSSGATAGGNAGNAT